MSSQSHDRRLDGWSEIPKLYGAIRGRCGNEVFVLVKIAWEHLIIVGMYSLDILATSDVPDSDSLVATAWPKNALVSRMPHCLIHYEVMHEGLLANTRTLDVPELNRSIQYLLALSSYLSYDALSIFLLLMWFHSQPNTSPVCSLKTLTGAVLATSKSLRLPSPPALSSWLGLASLKQTSYWASGVAHSLSRPMSASFTCREIIHEVVT